MKISNEKLKIFYVANVRIPTEKAHGIQIMKMCEAFALCGADVTLVLPKRHDPIKQDPFSYYKVKPIFKIKKLPTLDMSFIDSRITFILSAFIFSVSSFIFLFFRKKDYVVYTRGETILFLSKFLSRRLFWETHIKPSNIDRYKKAVRNIGGVIVATKYYKDLLINEFRLESPKIWYAPDGVDLDIFGVDMAREDARKMLDLPTNKKIIVYTGSLLKWKGVETLVNATKFLNDDSLLYIIGDLKNDDNYYYLPSVDTSSKIKFVGLRPYSEIPLWLKASDILVLTGTDKNETSKYYTSPLKLFEYMASRRPIVAPKIPSFLDILNDENSFLVESDNAEKLADKIKSALGNKDESKDKAGRAYNDSKCYSWSKRAEDIIKFIKMNTENL